MGHLSRDACLKGRCFELNDALAERGFIDSRGLGVRGQASEE